MKQWLDRYGPWLALFVSAAAYYPRFIAPEAGISLYSQAAQCLLNNQILQQCSAPFTYPPAFAFVMIPLAPMPMWLRALVWYAMTIGATLGAFGLSERLGGKLFAAPFAKQEMLWVRTIALILSLKFVLAVLENQAYDTFALLFILWGLVKLADGRELAGAAALAFAAAIKAAPLIFLPYLLVKKRFAAAAAFTVVLLAVSYAPDIFFTPQGGAHGYFHTWLREIAGTSLGLTNEAPKSPFWVGAGPHNHSLRGAVSLQIDEIGQVAMHKRVLYGIELLFIAFAAALLLLRKARAEMIGIDGSILLISMLMLSPMTSRSHYVSLVLPYTVLVMVMLRDQATRALGAAVLAISLVLLTATSNDAAGQVLSDYAYNHSFLVLGALSLFIYIAAIVWNPAVLRDARPFVWRRARPAASPLAGGDR